MKAMYPLVFGVRGTKQILLGLVLGVAVMAPNGPLAAAGPEPVDLRSTANFRILAGAAITSTGHGNIHGDVGASPIAGSAIGMTQAQVQGTIYAVDASGPAGSVIAPALLTAAKGDLTTAYNAAAGRTPIPTGAFLNPGGGNIGGLNLVPGLYKFTSTALITGSDVTLTGGPNDVWIFQIVADLQVGSGIKVILAGGAQAGNIFWQVGTSAVLDSSSVFKGTIMADQAITMKTSSTMEGRALARSAGVTFNGASISQPTPSGAPSWKIILQNDDGYVGRWLMSGTYALSWAPLNPNQMDPSWQVAGWANLDGTGEPQLLLRQSAGFVGLWRMSEDTVTGFEYTAPTIADPSWHVAAVGDLNGDGKDDVLWQNGGYLGAWIMNDKTATAWVWLNPNAVGPGWKVVGLADFNGDGKPDVLFQHDSGYLGVWYMNGVNATQWTLLNPNSVSSGWKVVGTADVNGDGQKDIIFQHGSGYLGVWFMIGLNATDWSYLNPNSTDPGWKVRAVR